MISFKKNLSGRYAKEKRQIFNDLLHFIRENMREMSIIYVFIIRYFFRFNFKQNRKKPIKT